MSENTQTALEKRALVYSHLGLGDMFWMNGAVRYLATRHNEVIVVCKHRNAAAAESMYADNPAIKLLLIEGDADLSPWDEKRHLFLQQGMAVYSCGFFAPRLDKAIYNLPISFYDDMGIPHEFRYKHFYVPRSQEGKALCKRFESIRYIVVHEESSVQKLPIAKKLMEKGEMRLILDLNKNPYGTAHGWWAAAEKVAGRPILEYIELIEGAEELHMIESAVYCLASHLDLSKVKRKVCYDPWGGNAERLGVFETGFIQNLASE